MTSSNYAIIRAEGDDAFDFLQGQLSNDLRRLDGSTPQLSAWCNPKGRVISVLRVQKTTDGYDLALPANLAQTMLDRLVLFRFRARVELSIAEVEPSRFGIVEPVDTWRLGNLREGIAEIDRDNSEAYTPHMLNLDLLGAVSLDKGCYTGQEIVARTHYRGATKRRMMLFRSGGRVAPGDAVLAGERKIGTVVNAINDELLAVVPVAERDADLNVGEATLERRPLPYLDEASLAD